MTEPLLPPIPEGLKVLRNAHGYNHYFTHLQMDKYGRDCANAAIEHYIAQQAAREPVAYFDFQEHGFYWAPNVKIGEVPVIRKVAPMPLYSEPDMYKSESKTNTSQERVQKSEKSEQVPLTDDQIEAAVPAGIYDCLADPWDEGVGDRDEMRSIKKDVLRIARAIEAAHGIGEKV